MMQEEIRTCSACIHLELGPKPIFQFSRFSKILLAGQAPGRITHSKGVPFDDPSGTRLRYWLGVSREEFYDDKCFAILPMAFCFPGSAKGGDLAPPTLCAQKWRQRVLDTLEQIELTVVIGRYAIDWHLPRYKNDSVTNVVQERSTSDFDVIVLPHPSPRNIRWLVKNPWFERDRVPLLQKRVAEILS